MNYLHYFSIKTGEDCEPFPYKAPDYKIVSAISVWNDEARKGRFRRALYMLDLYDKARKFDEINKKKTLWQRIKAVFNAKTN